MHNYHVWRVLRACFFCTLFVIVGTAFGDVPDPQPVAPDPFPVASSESADPFPCDCVNTGKCDCPTGCGCCASGLEICGESGCSGPGCRMQQQSPFAVPQSQMTYSLRPAASATTQMGHTHQCPKCGYVWDHSEDGGAHRCPKCGTAQNIVSNLPPTRTRAAQSVQYTSAVVNLGGPAELWESPRAAFVSYSAAPTAAASVSYSMSGGCGSAASSFASAGRSSSSGGAGRQPLLRMRGGPGLLSSLFGGRRSCGG